jgi:hypothetical protein
MYSNSSDIVVVDATDCGSGGGGSTQLWPDRAVAAGSGGGSRISKTTAWIWRRGGRSMWERCPNTMRQRRGVGDGGSGAVWEASASGDQTVSFDLLTA